ncbi:MAG: hypothetical protein EOL87_05680 [Spartobacteria bacterium]|nr:hypothetical protein [Spartobacteria bacterium]
MTFRAPFSSFAIEQHWLRVMKAGVILLLLAALFLPFSSPRDPLWQCAWNMMHAPLAFVFTWALHSMLCRYLPGLRGSAMVAAGFILVGMLLAETIQPLFGRHNDSQDVYFAGCGIFFYVLCFWHRRWWRPSARRAAGLMQWLLLAAYAYPLGVLSLDRWERNQSFPVIAPFSTQREWHRWYKYGVQFERDETLASEVWLVPLPMDGTMHYPGVFLKDMIHDWSAYNALVLSIVNELDVDLRMEIRLDDRRGNPPYADRVQQSFALHPGGNTLHFGFKNWRSTPSGRLFDFSNVTKMGLFWCADVDTPVRIQLQYVTLENRGTDETVHRDPHL